MDFSYILFMAMGQKEFRHLLEEVRLGNRRAQKKLYESYYAYAKNICLHYSSSDEEAVEILNDGFLTVFLHIELYDDTLSFKAWLRKILINKSIDYFRKYHKVEIINLDHVQDGSMEYDYPDLDDIDTLIPALRQLSPAYRLVINLHILEEYTHEEIARKLNISSGTVRSNYCRAIGNLRKLISTDQMVRAK